MATSKKLRLSVSHAALFFTRFRLIALRGRSVLASAALSPHASRKNPVHRITDATVYHSPSFAGRQMKKKSNDAGIVVVPLLPFTIALTTDIDDAGADSRLAQPLARTARQPEAPAVDQALQDLAISILNASSFADRFYDIDLHVFHQQSSLQKYWTMSVNGNATFTGSYFLDDPEPKQVTTVLVQEWNDEKDILMNALSPIVCSDTNTHGNTPCVLSDVTVELLDDAAMSDYTTNITLDDVYAKETTDIVTRPMHDEVQKPDDSSSSNIMSYRSNADDTTNNNTSGPLAWVIPTIITATLILFSAFLIAYRRVRKEKHSQTLSRESNNLQEARCTSQNDGRVTNNNNVITTFSNQNNIDQLIQEFTNNNDDMSLASSDPSDIGNASFFSGLSGFSHLDLERGIARNDDHGNRENNRNNGSTYLPSNLRKHESFEGKYRSISAMVNVLKKDILLIAGETAAETTPPQTGHGVSNDNENEIMGVSRTESPKKRKEMMERQRIAESGDADGREGRVDICSAGEEIELDRNSRHDVQRHTGD
ncbi:hypothetical protein HJC23_006487 [Cyclotella cryptica]|uniref:Uncharacterized protein n=1 Tax=Cyclotella cryptica TaxID=29204 RepID=A0ABD3PNH6_9STRA|eukprot:CCRYP_012974-RA/>CCRYP_012974-RA protein AED:0.42 eAED:0.42 QI:0/-1/0/1/-1/1/1/0/538